MERTAAKAGRRSGKLPAGISDRAFSVLTTLFMVVIMAVIAYPLYYVLIASFSDPYDVYAGKTFFWISQPTVEGYVRVFRDPDILTGYRNTILYTVIGTLFSTSLVMMTAYPLSRPLPGKKGIMVFFVFTMYFSGGLIPTYIVVRNLHLINSIWALFLPGGVSVFNVIVSRVFFEKSIPKELYDSAAIDGADELRTFLNVALPLARPIIAVMAVFSMVAYWNDWFTALIYLPAASKAPLQLVLRQILVKSQTAGSMLGGMAGGYADKLRITELIKFSSIIVSTVPMMIFYPFVQKYFEKGIMVGAVKG